METLSVALVIPLQGPAGIFGPSCELCARLAAEEINAGSGLLGRELVFTVVDGGLPPRRVAAEVDRLISAGEVDAVTGWHISAVRQAVAPRIAGRVPYLYTPLYEGGEHTPWVFLTGETPARQLRPALRWMAEELGVRRWIIVGDDYVWPRESARAARRYVRESRGEIVGEFYVRLGTEDFGDCLRAIAASPCEGVLMLLVGQDAVAFNRAFAAAGLDRDHLRFSPLMDENMLMATGPASTRGLYSAAGFFEGLGTAGSLDFGGRYHARYGPDAPTLNSMGESCFEGVRLLGELLNRAGRLDMPSIYRCAEGLAYEGPRGTVRLRDHHLDQAVFLAEAVGMDFHVLQQL
ncbi:substrate-binding domain-containing protein [Nonomuraea sp. NN258]|uniref:substrate-binding domain-containing protein n=1 Tax=Nonomuraea antri TaxID=2730852 RepID=UPI0015697FC6|nr:substrate-binding domain-containing protein [Nonomuraea antri]NRQ40088.1 substrate-binding domain-containing protein [Nonomuraea antri]